MILKLNFLFDLMLVLIKVYNLMQLLLYILLF